MKTFFIISFLIICSVFATKTTFGYVYLPSLPPPPGSSQIPDGFCSDAIMVCWNSSAVGVTDCGTACPVGSAWERRNYDGCYSNPDDPSNPIVILQRTIDVCSTGDKCYLSDGPYLRPGSCDCGTAGGIYKVCCAASGGGLSSTCVQFSGDNRNPPYEGYCPADSDDSNGHFCGWGIYPPCDSICGPPPPGAPTAGGGTIAYCNGASVNMDFYWSPGSGATSHQVRHGVGSCDPRTQPAAGCVQTVNLVASPQTVTGFTPNQTVNYEFFACNSGGCTPTTNGYFAKSPGAGTYPASCGPVPTATPTPTPAGLGCPAVQGGFPNQCRNAACLTGSTQVNGASGTTACQGFNGTNACCNITGTCPSNPGAGMTNTCRAGSSCNAGETIYSGGTGNAACGNFLGVTSGGAVCCCSGAGCSGGSNDFTLRANGSLGSISVTPGSTVSISWNHISGSVDGCVASSSPTNSNWDFIGSGTPVYGTMKFNGSQNVVVNQNTTFSADCYYPSGTSPITRSVTVNVSALPPPVTCPDGFCSAAEDCSSCSADCGVCPTPTPAAICGDGICNGAETAATCNDCTVQIRGRIVEDNNRDGVVNAGDTSYSGTTVSLSGTSSGSTVTNSSSPYNFTFSNRTATNDNYTLNFVMPANYELVGGAAKPKSFNVNGSGDADLTNSIWLIREINQCDDGIDNDGDGGTDCDPGGCASGVCDTACWPVSGNPYDTDPAQCCTNPPCQETPPGGTQCSDSRDNADPEDALIDGGDPGCHTDGNAANRATYDPNDNNETDLPNCTTQSISPNPINAGGQTTLTVGNCVNITPTVTPTTTPPFAWTPTPNQPPGSGRDCSDGTDNDSDSAIDSGDPGCHADSNPNNPSSYDPNDDDETNGGGTPECSDGADNDTDSFIDTNDPGCHTDGNPSNPASYDPNDDHESSIPYPECSDGRDNADPDVLVDYQDPECHTDGDTTNPDTYNPNDPSESTSGNSCSDAGVSNTSNDAGYTSGSAVWTAPACPGNAGLTCPVSMRVNGPGGSRNISLGNVTVNPTWNITVQVQEDTNYNDCTAGATPYAGNVQVGLLRTSPIPQQSATRTMSGGSETFSCQLPGDYEISIATPGGYRGVGAALVSGGPQSAGSQVSINQFNLTLGNSNPTVRFCITSLAPWIQTDSGDVRFNIIDNPVPAGKSASANASSPSLLFSSMGDGDIGLGSVSPGGDKEWVIDDEYSYNRNMKSVNGSAAYTFYKSRTKQRNITLNPLALGGAGAVAPPATGVYEITGDSNGDFDLTGYTHPVVAGAPGRVVLLVPGDLTISSEIDVPTGGLLIVAVQGSITISESVGAEEADYATTNAHLNGIFTAERDILIPGNLCIDGVTLDRKLNIAGSIVANARKPFADDSVSGGIIDNQRSLCQADADYASVNIATRADFLLQLTDFYKTTYSRWKEVRP